MGLKMNVLNCCPYKSNMTALNLFKGYFLYVKGIFKSCFLDVPLFEFQNNIINVFEKSVMYNEVLIWVHYYSSVMKNFLYTDI